MSKRMHAIVIESVERDGSYGAVLTFKDEGFGPIRVSSSYVEKHDPKPGGYYVFHEDDGGEAPWPEMFPPEGSYAAVLS